MAGGSDAATWRVRLADYGWILVVMAGGAGLSFYLLPMPVALFAAFLVIVAIFIAIVDIEYLVIPDSANALLFAAGLFLVFVEAGRGDYFSAFADALLRCLVAGGVFALLRFSYMRRSGAEGLGLGDAKLVAATAPFLAWSSLPIALLIASAAGLLAVGARAAIARRMPDRNAEIPFGAFLAPAIWVAFLIERTGLLAP
jgi:leader peptidase (prepilin peptidase)/N-methyltransferase